MKISLLDRVLAFQHRRRWRGRSRVRTLLQRHQPYFLIRARTRHGLTLALDPSQYVDGTVIDAGYYEEEVLSAILQHVGETGVFWDVGANIGLHSITVKHLRPSATVIAFEPSPFTFVRLASNVAETGVEVRLLNVALNETVGYFTLSLMMQGNSGLTSLRPWHGVNYESTMLCRCETGESVLASARLPVPTVMKIDVEGLEYEVLAGFGSILAARQLRAVVFEAQADFLDRPDAYPIWRLVTDAGFTVTALPAPGSADPVTNFLAVRE